MTDGKVRKRAFAVKLRSGCKTCKRRHVKCDEGQPTCFRCRSSGRRCEGYETIRVAQTKATAKGSLSLTWSQPLSAQPDASSYELLAFKYFQYSCGAIVQNEFKYRPLFEYILQVAQVEPSVWHATVALGSLQRPENAPDVNNGVAFGFSQYGKAVKILNRSIATPASLRSEVVLATSLLFATFEVLHKDFMKGSQHINASMNYMCHLVQAGDAYDGVVFAALVDVFARLTISASIFRGQRSNISTDPFTWLTTHLTRSEEFSMAVAGYGVLFCLSAMRILEQVDDQEIPHDRLQPNRLLRLRGELLDSIEFWQVSMEKLKATRMDDSTQHRAILLEIYMSYCKISVSSLRMGSTEPSELRYDTHIWNFRRLLASCRDFMERGDLETYEQGGLRYPSFTIHIGIIHILWYISIKCRDPHIRRDAVKLLNHCHHGEGDTFDGVMISGYADMVIKLEEGSQSTNSAQDVSADRRISRPYFNVVHDDHVLHCEKGDFRLGDEWTKRQPICVFSV